MRVKQIGIVFSKHSIDRLKQRLPGGHGLAKGGFIRLLQVRKEERNRKAQWLLRIASGVLLGTLRREKKKRNRDVLIVRTVLDDAMFHNQQRKARRQFIPLESRLFQIKGIGAIPHSEEPTMPEQASGKNDSDVGC